MVTDWNKLESQQLEALKKGILTTNPDSWVSAKMRFQDQQFALSARLKGDWADHFNTSKWSFRLRSKTGQALQGQTVWSLHAPKARYFLHEWLFHQLLQEQGVLATPYEFIRLDINQQSKGIYAMEGHFEPALLERQQRVNGPILKWDEAGYWAINERLVHLSPKNREVTPHPLFEQETAPITVFQAAYWKASPDRQDIANQAKERLAGFVEERYSAAETFKLKELAFFLAASDLCLAYHGLYWHNLRFYYDPAVGKLEPIAFDSYGEEPMSSNTFLGAQAFSKAAEIPNPLLARLFEDKDFLRKYVQAIEEISQPSFWRTFLDKKEGHWIPRLQWLQEEFPYYHWSPSIWAERAQYLQDLLIPLEGFSVRVERVGASFKLENFHTLPIDIQLPNGQWKTVIPRGNLVIKNPSSSTMVYRVTGLDSLFRASVNMLDIVGSISTSALQIPQDLPLLVEGQQIRLEGADTITISSPLVVPNDYSLDLKNLTINLEKGSHIEIYGPCAWENVHLISRDQSGRGIYLRGSQSVHWKGVIVEQQNPPFIHQYQQFGAVTMIDSRVELKQCVFKENNSEDGLYLLRSQVNLKECSFTEQLSDGLDLDFCTGELKSCTFFLNGNDGLDIAGGRLHLERLILDGNQEKGLSIGEGAQVEALNLRIINSPTGMAVKDQSEAKLQYVYLKNVNLGIGVYQKKSIFGPATCRVDSIYLERVPHLYRLGLGSTLILDGQMLEGR
ncbi:MAG: right-handed parallel beta-helix repeat-containing protein [Bacteroidota bacterium]